MEPKKCIAMLLAGGRGSRLSILTNDLAKPALPFGGKYRIIDFALSNCTNSGMEVVGVLTQYKPLVLNSYISGGQPWDLDRIHGGVYVLPPYVTEEEEGHWYKGTADAIYQNIDFIQGHDPDDVLVLSGDHIYRMDYSKMLKFHRENQADATIAVIEVPWEEAPRFGIMTSDETGAIQKFVEKPQHPDSNQASMGVYIFKWAALKQYLLADKKNPASQNDFGKNIIPAMLENGRRMFSYAFDGYWKDVGTIQSYWEANMDLIGDPPTLQMDPQWRIYTRTPVQPPHYIADTANVTASYVTEGCNLYGTVVHSVLSAKVQIQEGARVTDSILMPGVRVGAGSKLCRAIVGTGTVIGPGCIIGGAEHDSGAITTVGDHCTLLPGTVVPAGATVDQAALEKLYKQQEREKGGAAL